MIRKIELQLPNRHDILLKKQNACLGLSFFLREPEFAGIPKSLSAPGSRYSYSCGPRAERQRLRVNCHCTRAFGRSFCLTDSLIGYCRCLSAIDTREQEAAKERVRLWEIHSRYYELITELFHRLAGLKKSDPIWKELDFSKWEWLFERVSTRWSFLFRRVRCSCSTNLKLLTLFPAPTFIIL